jgi:hypothetical protein
MILTDAFHFKLEHTLKASFCHLLKSGAFASSTAMYTNRIGSGATSAEPLGTSRRIRTTSR